MDTKAAAAAAPPLPPPLPPQPSPPWRQRKYFPDTDPSISHWKSTFVQTFI